MNPAARRRIAGFLDKERRNTIEPADDLHGQQRMIVDFGVAIITTGSRVAGACRSRHLCQLPRMVFTIPLHLLNAERAAGVFHGDGDEPVIGNKDFSDTASGVRHVLVRQGPAIRRVMARSRQWPGHAPTDGIAGTR